MTSGMTDRPDAPAPMRRLGPRPLALHLTLSAKSPGSAAGSPSWKPAPDPAFVRGIAAYRRHPYQRTLADPPALWAEGGSRLLDYGGAGLNVLFVPSLVNRAYILDLAPERSMLRTLAAQGVRPLLLDWGWPGEEERRFSLTDYIAGRLARAIAAVPGPLVLAGYCMGGLLALAAALHQPRLRGLVLLATPWDFHAASGPPARAILAQAGLLMEGGPLPIDALQAMFALQGNDLVADKFRHFATMDQDSEAARLFVALEDWLADGMPLAAPVARECLGGWYGDNTTARLQWRVAGQVVDPAALRLPVLVAVPARDRIVPPDSAIPLAKIIPGAEMLQPAAGHVGMVAGARAAPELWMPMLGWLQARGVPI